jgi:hypothetical protein
MSWNQVKESVCMNQRILLRLFAVPTLVSSVLAMSLMTGLASASETIKNSTKNSASCDAPTQELLKASGISLHKGNTRLIASSAIPLEGISIDVPGADFTEAESDAAVTLFGCDCSSCMAALQRMRAQAALSTGEGHCWTAMQQRVSPEEARSILQALEDQESK